MSDSVASRGEHQNMFISSCSKMFEFGAQVKNVNVLETVGHQSIFRCHVANEIKLERYV